MCAVPALSALSRLQEPSQTKWAELNGLSPVINTAGLPTLLCIWSVCSQAAWLRADVQHFKLASSPTQTSLRRAHMYAARLFFFPSVLQLRILVDRCRRVAAGSETKLEQWQVKPTRSHVFWKPQPSYLPHRKICLSVNVMSLSFTFMSHFKNWDMDNTM